MGPKAFVMMAEHSSRDDPARGRPYATGAEGGSDAVGKGSPVMTRGATHEPGANGPEAGSAEVGRLTVPVFEVVYAEQFHFVWRSLRLLGVDPEGLEDAAQDVFSVVSRQLAGFEGRSSMRTWLFAILQRVAANHRRTRRRKLQQLEPLDESLVDEEPTPHAHAEATEVLAVIERFCSGLDDEWRAVFVLSLLENIPAHEVAHALGVPLNTVYSRVRSLREGLRRALASRGGRGRR